MSVSSISQSNVLGVDVLLMIFQQLEGEDLVKCEAVCRQWQDILLAGTPWRRLFHRQVDCSHLWQNEQKKLEANQQTLRTDQYRDVCRKILRVERNWLIGKFTKSIYRSGTQESLRLTMSDDYIAWDTRFGAKFVDTESMELTKIRVPPGSRHKVEDGALITFQHYFNGNPHLNFEISDPKHRYCVNVVDSEEKDVNSIYYVASMRNKLFAENSRKNGVYRFRIWKLGHPSTLLKKYNHKSDSRESQIFRVKLAERFLILESHSGIFTLVSIENEATRVIPLAYCHCIYAEGLFFPPYYLYSYGSIRVRIADSGTNLSDVHLPFLNKPSGDGITCNEVGANSKFIVIDWKYCNEKMLSYFSVYDLQAIKNSNSDPNRHLLYTLEVPLEVESFVMNEIQIICKVVNRENYNNLIVINFAKLAFNGKSSLRKNYRANKKIEIKIISGPCVHRDFFAK